MVAAKAYVNPSVKITANDYLVGAVVGAAAGALLVGGAAVAAGAAVGSAAAIGGAAMTGGGMGTAGSAIGYTVASGDSYNSQAMITNAAIGGASGAVGGAMGAVAQGPISTYKYAASTKFFNNVGQVGVSMLSSQVQTLATNAVAGDQTTLGEYVAAPFTGGATNIMANMFFGGNSFAREMLRAAGTETMNNWFMGEVDKRTDTTE